MRSRGLMMLINSFDEISVPWIEDVLAQRFNISSGIVKSFRLRIQSQTPSSRFAILEIDYKNAASGLPPSLFVKIALQEKDPYNPFNNGFKEVRFYKEILPRLERSDYVDCYYAAHTGRSFTLVLEDISATHFTTDWPLPPTLKCCAKAMDCLARLHAYWWENKDLEKIAGRMATKKELVEEAENGRKTIDAFLAFMEDRLSEERKGIILSIVDNYDSFIDRFASYKCITLIRLDNHFWNFMYPKSDEGTVKMIDWMSWQYGLATEDLANMIAMHLYPDRRRVHERKLLKRYYDRIIEYGIKEYSFDEFIHDYRWSIISRLICQPIFLWSTNCPASHWYNDLEKIFSAYEDWNCGELLK
jgi:hypothetical protein